MSTLTIDQTTSTTDPAPALDPLRVEPVSQARVLRSEWIKLRSLRSSAFTLLAAVVAMIGIGWIVGWATNAHWATQPADAIASFNPIANSLSGYHLAQLAVGVLGVLLVTGEYATGMIRATFQSVPKRLPVLWAKAALYGGVTFTLMLVATFAAFLGGQQFLGTHGTTLSATGAVQDIFGVVGYLTLIGVFAVALGFIIRRTAGGIAALFGLLLVLPGIGLVLPATWQAHTLPYLPSNAGASMFSTQTATGSLSAGTGLLVMLAWVAAALAGAALLIKRRDA